mgnify:CR=1 FL=1
MSEDEYDEEFEKTMDEFIEKVASIDACYNNGYKLITAKQTLAELTTEKLVVLFPFNPSKLEDFLNVADLMISYFEQNEEYERALAGPSFVLYLQMPSRGTMLYRRLYMMRNDISRTMKMPKSADFPTIL